MSKARRALLFAVLFALPGCGGASTDFDVPEGGTTPEQAVRTFLAAAGEAQQQRTAGNLDQAERAYRGMAAVFGTESGSILRTHQNEEVRGRMVVLAACLRPVSYRIVSGDDPIARRTGRVTVTVEIDRGSGQVTIPFRTVQGREDRWYIEQIEVADLTC